MRREPQATRLDDEDNLDRPHLSLPRDSTIERRAFLQKAGLGAAVAGAAWVAPSVVGFDVAFAAGSCAVPGTYSFATMTSGNAPTATTLTATGGKPAVTITPSLASTNGGGGTNNYTVQNAQVGGQTANSLRLSMDVGASGRGYSVTFTFSVAVTNVVFSLFDIDRQNNGGSGFQDTVSLTVTPGSSTWTDTKPGATVVTGNGTSTTPWIGTGNTQVVPSSPDGNVIVTIPGSVTAVTVNYRSGDLWGAAQAIAISNLTFCR